MQNARGAATRPHTSTPSPSETTAAEAALREAMLAGANASGGWGYYPGKASRLEPTCWTELALGAAAPAPSRAFLVRCQQTTGWLAEDPRWPVNIAFNGLAAFTWLSRPELATDEARRRLLAALTSSKGVTAPPLDGSTQDNSLQGWSWIDAMFSWVEPTCWGLLALKKARRAGITDASAQARIDEAERLLINRACSTGGWNYGNATMMHQDLRPYVPTTALGLLALQDRRADPVVTRSVAFLENHWSDEISAPSIGLSLICLNVYGRPVNALAARLREHVEQARSFGNLHGMAIALFALTTTGQAHAFTI
jgi:hypothetical protein